MVFLEELPSKYGFHSFLFEEISSYDKEKLEQKYETWLEKMLSQAEESEIH